MRAQIAHRFEALVAELAAEAKAARDDLERA